MNSVPCLEALRLCCQLVRARLAYTQGEQTLDCHLAPFLLRKSINIALPFLPILKLGAWILEGKPSFADQNVCKSGPRAAYLHLSSILSWWVKNN